MWKCICCEREKPMLMADCLGDNEVVFGSKISRGEVCEIDFVKMNLASIPSGAWDVSDDQSRTIWAWISREADGMSALKIGSENGVYANINCSELFCKYSNVRRIEFNNLFDTSRTTDMGKMFCACKNLQNLDVSRFETKHVENMASMFLKCKSLLELELTNFKTDKVKNMSAMFDSCENLKSLDVSRFETGSVEDMNCMFAGCEALSELDVSRFDTRNVIDMSWMFDECKSLAALDVSNFKTERVTDMERMFYDCSNLTQLDTSNFCYAQNVNVQDMFTSCGVSQDISKQVLMADCIGDDEENES